jgi:hypothetical protein
MEGALAGAVQGIEIATHPPASLLLVAHCSTASYPLKKETPESRSVCLKRTVYFNNINRVE